MFSDFVIMLRRLFFYILCAVSLLELVSCSGDDYINSIPSGSTAIVKVDLQKALGNSQQARLLTDVLNIKDVSDCGLNLSKPVYLFESPDGNIGIAVEVQKRGKVGDWLNSLASSGICQKPVERHDILLTVVKGSWMAAVSDEAMLVMGPATAAAQPELMRTAMRLLKQDEEDGAKNSPLFTKLETLDSPVSLVAQADALPEALVAPFTLGTPKGTSPSDVLIAARMTVSKPNILKIDGETYSENPQTDRALKSSFSDYRPIGSTFLTTMTDSAAMGLFMNVDGKKFIKLMQQDKALLQLMSGINTVIDINKIVDSVDGDMAVILPRYSDTNLQLMWGAKLRDSQFLNDVDYWKQSVPAGGRMTDEGRDFYQYTDGQTRFFLGVSPELLFYSGSSAPQAQSLLHPAAKAIPQDVAAMVKGKSMAAVVNLKAFKAGNGIMGTVQTFMAPLFGGVDYVVYTMK